MSDIPDLPPFQVAEIHVPAIEGPIVLPWHLDQEREQMVTYMVPDIAAKVLDGAREIEKAGGETLAAMAITYGSNTGDLLTATVQFWPLLLLDAGTAKPEPDTTDPAWPVYWTPQEEPDDPVKALRHLTLTLSRLMAAGAHLALMDDAPDGIQMPDGLVDPTGKPLA